MNHPLSSSSPGSGRRVPIPVPVAVVVLGLALTSCTTTPAGPVDGRKSATTAVREGGSLVFGAEQEPDCVDWIATCGASIWGTYMLQAQTIPRVFDVRKKGKDWVPVPSAMMASDPVISTGARPKITYRLDPKAVWSDGRPITSADLKYTALQIRDGKNIFDKTGYTEIASVETPGPKTAVVTLKRPLGSWKGLFSGSYGVLPSHLLRGKDRTKLMKDGYQFSGGPWKLDKWVRGTSLTLVPNDRYWGKKPHLSKVTFQFTSDTAAAFQAFRTGQLDALYPSPQLDVIDQIKQGLPNASVQTEAQTGSLEALWMNNGRFPFDSPAVRRAVSYAIDREALVERLYGPLGVKQPAQSFNSPLVSRYAATDFSAYSLDLKKVEEIMTADGWAKGGDGIWAKDGRKAKFTVTTMAGNKRRELTEQILQTQLEKAGFAMGIQNTSAANLFAKVAPAGDFDLGLWTLVDTFPEPSLGASFLASSIPSAANGNAGINFMRARVPGLDPVLKEVAAAMDDATRRTASLKAERIIADEVPSLPLSAVPNVLLWNKRVGGPVSINPVEGPWWNLADWGRAE
ncbi:peptide ABC transporter substrate-binding protein [Streptomyces sp. NPDC058001]|uniref:peptide ABC transporter substrate-binding protein n=1 Tax=Streptomyces sp. NPDC058001 TaxID=3346300 RepID=UPI0036EEF7CC